MNSGRGESTDISSLGVVLREEGFFTMRMLTKSSSDVASRGSLSWDEAVDLRLLLRLFVLFGIVSDRQVAKVLGYETHCASILLPYMGVCFLRES